MIDTKISVIIPTHNRADALDLTLQKLSEQLFDANWEVIVINNNCTDDTDQIVEKWKRRLLVTLTLVHEKKPGAAAARNAGVKVAKGEYLVFIDNDILTEPDFLQRHFDVLQRNSNSWIVGQIVNLPAQENSVFGKYRKTLFPVIAPSEEIRETDGITGANSSMPRADFEKLGGFDENFEIASSEDHELAMRARKNLGIKILLAPDISVVHNDWAGWTFPDFCRRVEMYANTEFFFWQEYGEEHPRQLLIKENLPADWRRDSIRLILRKKVKRFLSYRALQSALLYSCVILEKFQATQPILYRLYKLTLVGATHRGFSEGRKQVLEKNREK